MIVKIFRRLNLLLHIFLFGVLFFILTTSTASAQVSTTDCTSTDNLAVNGCFEEPVVPTGTTGAGYAYFSSVPGWTLTQFAANGATCPSVQAELQRNGQAGVASYEGVQFLEFDSGCDSLGTASAQTVAISQIIDTTPYHTYEISFAFRRVPGALADDANLVLHWNDFPLFDQPAPADWQYVTLQVIADAENTELYFVDDDIFPEQHGTVIDDVSVIDLGASCVIDPDNLVMNGCFEVPMITEPIFQFFTAGQVPGWNMEQFPASVPICPTTFFEIQVEQNAMTAYEGNQFAEFESGCDTGFTSQSTSIFQTIDTLPAHRYEVSFAGGGTGIDQFVRVEWNDDIIFDQTMALDWAMYSTEVIADSTQTVVKFSEPDDTPDFVGAVIDNIRVVDLGPVYGDLEVTKAVDWLGTPVNMAVEFEICITGPSYPSGDCFRFDGDGGTHLWDTLIPGAYTVLETLPGNDWVVIQPANPVIVPPNGMASAYVLNRLALGSVQATKSVNWNGVAVDGAQSFTLCINGALLNNIPDCQVVGANGGSVTWGELIPGNYSVYEFDPGSQWSASGGGSVGVQPGQTTFTTITNTHTPPVTITPPPPTCVHDLRLDLTGVLTNGDMSGQVTNNGAESCTYPIGIASYSMFDGNIDNQIIFDASTASVTIAPGQTVDIGPISLPACSAQVDLFYGDLITPQFNGARYGSRLLAATVVNRGNYCIP